jgi:hypothetical protein
MITKFKIFEDLNYSERLLAIAFKKIFMEFNDVKIYNFYSPIEIDRIGTIFIRRIVLPIPITKNYFPLTMTKNCSTIKIIFEMNIEYEYFSKIFQQHLDAEKLNYNLKVINKKREFYHGDKNNYYSFEINEEINTVIKLINHMKDDVRAYLTSKKYNL